MLIAMFDLISLGPSGSHHHLIAAKCQNAENEPSVKYVVLCDVFWGKQKICFLPWTVSHTTAGRQTGGQTDNVHLSICSSVCPSVHKTLDIYHINTN